MSEARDLALAEVEPGMVLAEAVVDGAGQVLLPAATALTDSHLTSLRRRGIATLRITPPADPLAEAAALAGERDRMRARVMYLFRNTADNPASQALLHAVLAFREGKPG